MEKAAADTGCTSHFIKDRLIQNETHHVPINVRQPDGTCFKSNSKGEIPLHKDLPYSARTAHGFKNIKTNLLSVGQFCDAGCTAIFDKEKCEIRRNNNILLRGDREKRNGLWYIPLYTSEGAPLLTKVSKPTQYISSYEGAKTIGGECNNLH